MRCRADGGSSPGVAAHDGPHLVCSIEHERCHRREEVLQELLHFVRKCRLIKSSIHQLNPAVARGLIDRKRRVTHSQPGMAALLDIGWRSPESINQKIAKPLFRAFKVVRRIHRAQHVVGRHLPVKRRHQPLKSVTADNRINFALVHSFIVPGQSLGFRKLIIEPIQRSGLQVEFERQIVGLDRSH